MKKKKKLKRFIMKKETVVKLFIAMGFKTAGTWEDSRLLRKIKELPELVDEVKIKNPKAKEILKKILSAKEIVFKTEEEPERASEKAMRETADGLDKDTKKKTTKKKTTKKKTTEKKTKKAKAKKSVVEKDGFGRRLNTQGSLINTKLDKRGKTVEQLAKETKLPIGRISNHVRDLVGKGFVVKTKEVKYRIK